MSAPQPSSASFIIIFVVEIIAVAAVLFGVKNFYTGKNFYRMLEAYIILFGSFFFFFFVVGDLLPYIDPVALAAISFVLAAGVYLAKRRRVWNTQSLRNIVTLICSVGAGVFIGISIGAQFGVLVLYAVLGLFAVYDYLAVFVFKFMIPLAKQAVSMDLAFMIGSSEMELMPKSAKSKQELAYRKEALANIKSSYVRELVKKDNMPVVSSVMLGNGDIILPLAVASGAYAYTANLGLALVIVMGAGIGLIVTFGILRKYKLGLPAIPPIFAFVSLALAVFAAVTGAYGIIFMCIFLLAAAASLLAMYLTVKRQLKKGADK